MSSDEDEHRFNRLRGRSTSRRRSRSRSPPPRRSRSPSTPRRRSPVPRSPAPIGVLNDQAKLEDLLNKQQEFLTDLVNSHREEVDELVAAKSQQFRSKGIEKQYLHSSKVASKLSKIKKLLKKKKYDKALDSVRAALRLVEEHNEDLIVADSSRYGWLTVHTLRGHNQLPSDLSKKVEKIDSKLDKAKSATAGQHGPRQSKFYPRRMEAGGVQTWRKKQGPEEAIIAFSKSTRQGNCQQCNGAGHFYRECPEFWKAVNDQRVKEFGSGPK